MSTTNVLLKHQHRGFRAEGHRKSLPPSTSKPYLDTRESALLEEEPDPLALDTLDETAFERALWERR